MLRRAALHGRQTKSCMAVTRGNEEVVYQSSVLSALVYHESSMTPSMTPYLLHPSLGEHAWRASWC